MHDTIGCYLDIDKGQIKFSKNGKLMPIKYLIRVKKMVQIFELAFFPLGKDLGLAFEIPPHLKNQALFASCVLKVISIFFKST